MQLGGFGFHPRRSSGPADDSRASPEKVATGAPTCRPKRSVGTRLLFSPDSASRDATRNTITIGDLALPLVPLLHLRLGAGRGLKLVAADALRRPTGRSAYRYLSTVLHSSA